MKIKTQRGGGKGRDQNGNRRLRRFLMKQGRFQAVSDFDRWVEQFLTGSIATTVDRVKLDGTIVQCDPTKLFPLKPEALEIAMQNEALREFIVFPLPPMRTDIILTSLT